MFFFSNRVPASLQPVSCHNTYLPGEKLHLKDFQKRNHGRAPGWPGTIKRDGGKNERNTERGGQGGGGGESRSRNGTVRHTNSLGGSAAEMLQDPLGMGKLSIIVIFISRFATPDD